MLRGLTGNIVAFAATALAAVACRQVVREEMAPQMPGSGVREVALSPRPIALPQTAVSGVDLGIGDDRLYGRPVSWSLLEPLPRPGMLASVAESRPGVFIAWRNTELIEEVEVRVRNLGNEPGRGAVVVDVLDEAGNTLLHLEPPEDRRIVTVPPRDRGGEEGLVIKMQADRKLNRLIDLYDRARIRYDVRATVRTVDTRDANPADNAKVKAYNIPFRMHPGYRHTLNYTFGNASSSAREVVWLLESTAVPAGWNLRGSPLRQEAFTLPPGERIKGFLTIDVPSAAQEGDLIELRLSLIDVRTREVMQQHEWFLVHDTQPPDVSNRTMSLDDSGYVRLGELVADRGSGVLEASGVWTEYSTDGGLTFSVKGGNYRQGNFVDPTTFAATIGPFRPGTRLILWLNASDTAGNIRRLGPDTVTVR